MKNKKLIAPSILSADFSNLSMQIRNVELGGADVIHCDVMDGQFVPNITFGPMIIEAVRKITKLPIDTHLMIKNPDALIKEFIEAGSNYITVHQEEVVHLNRTINRIKELGAKAGVSINPSTPVSTLFEVLDIVDMVLVMSVNPGFGAQKFIPGTLKKIETLAAIREEKGYNYIIEIDGGINSENIKTVSKAGCNMFVVGWSIFGADNITASTMELKNLITSSN
ncbi:MAG: ribulose-phosphate 3-epimerase [Melioribacter sp.]|nr:ribulose-phosphate 3-epimerase [Melioribacter sp.]